MRGIILSIAIMAAACADTPRSGDIIAQASATVAELEQRESVDRAQLEVLRVNAASVRTSVALLSSRWSAVVRTFDESSAALEEAQALGETSAERLGQARNDFEHAVFAYRVTAAIIILSAASEAVGTDLCGQTMSTQRYRAELRDHGGNVDGQDVDHVWPRALGGADHPANYQMLDSTLNRGLGADVLAKISTWPLATLRGLVVSALVALRCG